MNYHKTIEDAYVEELLRVYQSSGEHEAARRLNNMLADVCRSLPKDTAFDAIKRAVHRICFKAMGGGP